MESPCGSLAKTCGYLGNSTAPLAVEHHEVDGSPALILLFKSRCSCRLILELKAVSARLSHSLPHGDSQVSRHVSQVGKFLTSLDLGKAYLDSHLGTASAVSQLLCSVPPFSAL